MPDTYQASPVKRIDLFGPVVVEAKEAGVNEAKVFDAIWFLIDEVGHDSRTSSLTPEGPRFFGSPG